MGRARGGVGAWREAVTAIHRSTPVPIGLVDTLSPPARLTPASGVAHD